MKKNNSTQTVSLRNKSLFRHLLSLSFLIFFTNGVLGQQVIGSFPYMDGGFENQTAGNISGTLSTTAWSVSSTSNSSVRSIINDASNARTGAKYASHTTTNTTVRLQSPYTATVANAPAPSTQFTIQYYYKTITDQTTPGATASLQGGIYNTTVSGSNSKSTLVTSTFVSGVWTKAYVTLNSNTDAVSATTNFACVRHLLTTTSNVQIDDYVVYPGILDTSAPNAPTSPTTSNPSSTSITVSWTAPADVDGGGYMIVRGTADPTTTPITNGIYAVNNTVAIGETVVYIGTATTFTDTPLTTDTHYFYRIYTVDKAFNYSTALSINAYSGASPSSSPLSIPTGINTTTTSSNGFSASWTAVPNASSYIVKTYIGGTNLISNTAVPSGTSTTVSGLMSGLDYTYKVIAIGDGVTYGDSPASDTQSFSTTGRVTSFITDFSDVATWGTPAPGVPANGSFYTGTINGFDLNAATLNANTTKGPKGESHTNRISLDKLNVGGSVTFPTIASVGQLEIHFGMGTATNTVNLKEYDATTNTWTLVGNYAYDLANKTAGIDQIIIVPFASAHTNAKFKIENNSSGSCYLTQIIARTNNPNLLPIVTNGVADAVTATSATLNWTPVANASGGYKVYLYKSTTLQSGYPISVSGVNSNSAAISGINPNTAYNYKVQAIGNEDVDYSDSYLSTASTFTTANTFSVSGTTSAASLTTLDVSSNVTISSGSTLNIDASKSVNSVTVDAGGKLNTATGNPLTVGTLTLKADKDITTFSSKIDATITATTVRLFKTIDDTKWYFLSFPCNVTVSEITKSNGDAMTGLGVDWFIKYYDGNKRSIDGVANGTNWVSVTSDGTLTAKKGYIFGLKTGMPETELLIPLNSSILAAEAESTVPVLSYSSGGAAEVHKGWNLVGHPYLSRYDSQTGSDAAYMVMPNVDGRTYTVKSKALSTLPQVDPFAAYFVQSAVDGNVTFGLTGRQSVRSLVGINQLDNIKLNLTTQTGKDETYLILDEIQSPSYQIGQDMEKWIGIGTDKPQIYTVLNGVNYAFNALPMNNVTNLPIGIYTKTGGATTISIDANQTTGISGVLLKDNSNGFVTDILASNYNFISDAGSNNGRFQITIQKISTGKSIEPKAGKPTVSVLNGQLLIQNVSGQVNVKVYDAVGHLLADKQSESSSINIPLNVAGVYTVKIGVGQKNWTKKIVL
jgi:hypothetical protein